MNEIDKIKFIAEGFRNVGVALIAGGAIGAVITTHSLSDYLLGLAVTVIGILNCFIGYFIFRGGLK